MLKLHNQSFGDQLTILNMRRLPGRLNVDQAAALIGCQPRDVPLLVRQKLLAPLGKPTPNAVKFFASCVLEEFMRDPKWLDAVTRAVNTYWHEDNAKRKIRHPEQNPEIS